MTKVFIFGIKGMYTENTKKHLLVKLLRKQGWSLLQNEETWLISEPYHIRLEEENFTLLVNVKGSKNLSVLQTFNYGRRQSQSLKRAVENHRRETIRCTNLDSNF